MSAVESGKEGIIIRSEMMEKNKIYTCIHQNKVFLFFKNEMGLISCYEVNDNDIADKIKTNPDPDSVKRILSEVIDKQ